MTSENLLDKNSVILSPSYRLPTFIVFVGLLFFTVALYSGQISSTILYQIPPSIFWNSVREWLITSDLPFMLVKALVFGLLIAIIACGWGLTTRGGPKEVGSSTPGAVVMTLITVSLVDVLLTQVLFG